jgi:multidrug efflux pump
MTRIVDWAVNNTRVVIAMLLVVLVAGVIAYQTIPKEAEPDVPIPVLIVQVTYPGISPEDSERLLVKPLETSLRSVAGIKTMTARAYSGVAVVILEFDVNFEAQKALEDVRAKIDEARSLLPAEANPPTVEEINTALQPVISVALSGDVPERTLLQLARNLKDEFKTIPSVLDVDIDGERQEMLEILIDPAKLQSYGISQQEMFTAVANNNKLIAAGLIDTGQGSFAVKVPGVIENANDLLTLPIRSTANSTITLGDVAQVRRTFYDPTTFARVNGQPTLSLDVTKRIGTNVIANNKAIRDVVAKEQAHWPAGIHVTYLFDDSQDIHDMLGSLTDSIILAIVLVMIIIVGALGLRAGLLVGVAIPTSFLMAFMVLNGLGLTMNEMMMFGMLLAVGILVDGAIIVVEYADRKMIEGLPPKLAFAEAARRMFWPVVSATATMSGAFLPMLLWPGITGKFMSYFPITLIVVLPASMFVALIFLPVIGGIFGRASEPDEAHERAIEASETGDWREIPGITGWYARLAERITRYPGRVALGAVGVVFAVIALFTVFNLGTEFFPDGDPGYARVYISARGNLSAEEKRDIVMHVSNLVQPIKGIRAVYASSGGQTNALNSTGGEPVDTIGHLGIEMKDYRERPTTQAIEEEIRKRTAGIPGVHIEVREPQSGPPTGKDIMIDVSSDDYADLAAVTAAVRDHMNGMKTLRDVEDTRPLPGIEWDLAINRELASRAGVDAQSIGTAVQLVTNGIMIGKYRPDDAHDEVDIRVRYPRQYRGIHALDGLRVATAGGSMVPISNFVTMKPAQQVNSIERVDGHRVYHIRANVKPGVNANAETAKIQSWVGTQTFPSDVRVKFTGGAEAADESGSFLIEAAFLALFLIAIVLLMLFNSFYHALLILVAVVLAIIGSMLGMVIMAQPFSIIMTGTGMLALAGIVVNHNIVLIDTFHRLRDSGMDPIEAVIRSSAQRLRPVFLTTITAIGGLLPMMFAVEINFATRDVTIGGPIELIWVQLSTAIVFGLAFSKAITLGLVPAMVALPYRIRERHGSVSRAMLHRAGDALRLPGRAVARLRGRGAKRQGPETQAAE